MRFIHSAAFIPIKLPSQNIDRKRYYVTPTGEKYPSITAVLSIDPRKKASLENWKNKIGPEEAHKISTQTSIRGSKFHAIVKSYLKNCYQKESYEDTSPVYLLFESVIPTLHRINNIYFQEAGLYSKELQIAGRVDCIAEFDGVPSIIDFKTSTKEKKLEWIEDYFVQEIAYGYMLNELYKVEVKQLVTIIVCENLTTQVFVETPKQKFLNKLIELRTLYREIYQR